MPAPYRQFWGIVKRQCVRLLGCNRGCTTECRLKALRIERAIESRQRMNAKGIATHAERMKAAKQ